MKIHRGKEYIHIDLSGAEAAVLLEELENVPGGSRLPKLKQVCEELRSSLALVELTTIAEARKRKHTPRKTLSLVVNEAPGADRTQDEKDVSDDGAGDADVGSRRPENDPHEAQNAPLSDG